jgi:lipopolysaccharide biosynthesis regulator YciM
VEILKEYPMYTSFVFVSLAEDFKTDNSVLKSTYQSRLEILRKYFLEMDDKDLLNSASVVLSRVRLLKDSAMYEDAFELLSNWIKNNKNASEVIKVEYIKLLIELDKKDEALSQTKTLLENLHQTLAKHYCRQCGYNSDSIFWRCPQCHEWETIQFRWKV